MKQSVLTYEWPKFNGDVEWFHVCHVDEYGLCRECQADAQIAVLKTLRHNKPLVQLSPLGEQFDADIRGVYEKP